MADYSHQPLGAECLTNPSGLTLGLTLIIVLVVISSPILILVNPNLVVATNSNMMDTSNNHATVSTSSSPDTIMESSPSTTVGTPTIQAALSSLTARPTNNIVNTNSFYDIVFLTASSGTIKTIEVTFPAGTTIPSGAFFNEAEGIGPGTASKSGQTITYTVTNAVNVPAGTKIRLEFANINNPLNPSSNYQVTVTTRDSGGSAIDGPSPTSAYTIKQIGVNAIANNAITTPKVATSFAYQKNLVDGENGWNPDGAATSFVILDSLLVSGFERILINVVTGGVGPVCSQTEIDPGSMTISCTAAPPDGSILNYAVINPTALPP